MPGEKCKMRHHFSPLEDNSNAINKISKWLERIY